jgi:hypothetical protein
MTTVDILDAIDAVTAPACGTCTEPLDPAGPSLYFCDDECSASWHRTQGEPLVGYREPWHRPLGFPGVGSDEHVSVDRERVVRTRIYDGSFSGARPDRILVDDGDEWREIGSVQNGALRWEDTPNPARQSWRGPAGRRHGPFSGPSAHPRPIDLDGLISGRAF